MDLGKPCIFTDDQKELIHQLWEHNQMVEAQKLIIGAVDMHTGTHAGTKLDHDSQFNSIAIHCPVCGQMAFITMTPVHRTGMSTVQSQCAHVRWTINEERNALDVDFMGNKNG